MTCGQSDALIAFIIQEGIGRNNQRTRLLLEECREGWLKLGACGRSYD